MVTMNQGLTWWISPLILPILVGLAGIVVWHVIPRRRANTRLLVQIPFFLTMSALLAAQHLVPYAPPPKGGTVAAMLLAGSVKLLWWLHLAWALIGFVRIYLVVEGKPREARLMQDLVVGVVYIGMLLAILAFVLAMPVGTLIATSGVFAIILGLALQNTLSDVFSGIALNLGRPYVLGDWIVLSDGTEGRVIETNWRSTHLINFTHNVVVLPNSFLAKLGITNVSYPDESHGLSIVVRLAPTRMPAVVVDMMRTVLESCNLILKDPPPAVAVSDLDATAIELKLIFRVAEVGQRLAARNEVYDLVYRHAKANGLLLAVPRSALISMTDLPTEETARAHEVTPLDLLRTIPIFASLTDEERQILATTTTVRTYRKGDTVAMVGQPLPSLMIVRAGVVARLRGEDDATMEVVGRLAPGDVFGEASFLGGAGEEFSLRALGSVTLYEIDRKNFASLQQTRPEFAADLAAAMAGKWTPPSGDAPSALQRAKPQTNILDGIRTAFRPKPLHGA